MNCKLGDIAFYVGHKIPAIIGILFEIVAFEPRADGTPAWRTNPQPGKFIPNLSAADGFCDSALRPIRDPGDDAVDQTLVPGYVRDEVTA